MQSHHILSNQVNKQLKWFAKHSIPLVKRNHIDVQKCEFTDDQGKLRERTLVLHPGAVVILPLVDKDSLIMIRNQRFVAGEDLWELPAGTLELNELPQQTAHRELIEETGFQAKEITPLTAFYTSPGFCNEAMYAFIARQLHFVGQNLDEEEKLTVHTMMWTEALELLYNGKIIDGKTIATLLYYHCFFPQLHPQ